MGNYTCVVTSMVTNARVLGSPTPLVLRSDGNETSSSALLRVNGAEAANKSNWENVKSTSRRIVTSCFLAQTIL